MLIIIKIVHLINLDCENCAKKIENRVLKINGISSAKVNFITQQLQIEIENNDFDTIYNEIVKVIKSMEPYIKVQRYNNNIHLNNNQKIIIIRILLSITIFAISSIFIKSTFLYIIGYIIISYDILIKAFKNILNGKIFDENFLMSIATLGAIFLKEYPEALAVMLFYQIGEFFQSYAVNKSRRSITELMNIRPDYANVVIENKIVTKKPEEVKIGDIIVINIGEKIALDGEVIEGISLIDTSNLTGESIPREVKIGDTVISGCINLTGSIKVKVLKDYSSSTVKKILDLVENASNKKSKSEKFITTFAKYYTPVVVICAVFLALFVPIIINDNIYIWLNRALTFLVISCPCALVISVPLSFFGGIGGASKIGILIKGSNYLEILSNTETIVFDKTGTLTKGKFRISQIYTKDIEKEEMLKYASYAEYYSNHPIAISIKNEYKENIDVTKIRDIENIGGHGIKAIVFNKKVIVSNAKYMIENNIDIDIDKIELDKTIAHIAIDGQYKGYILIEDEIKNNARECINNLKENGIKNIVMLTGDNKKIAEKVANYLNIDEFYAELLPDKKVEYLQNILCKNAENSKVAFVGDGINDAPVLSLSDIGISMGSLGSDAAIEASDIVIMDDNISKIVSAIKISKKTIKIVKQNIFFAISIKVIVLILGSFGITSMWMAIFSDVGISIIAILNAIRALNINKDDK